MKNKLTFILSILLIALAISGCNDKKRILFRTNERANIDLDSIIIENVQSPPILKIQRADLLTVTIGSITNIEEIPFIGSHDIVVDQDGILRIPKLGDFSALNKTAFELESELRDSVNNVLEEPEVSVVIKTYTIQILGSVNQPGIKLVSGGASINIVQAIGLAGNISESGNAQEIKVLRQVGNKLTSFTIDLTSLDAFNSNVLYLQSGDIIYVPKLKTLNVLKATTLINAISILINTIILISRL